MPSVGIGEACRDVGPHAEVSERGLYEDADPAEQQEPQEGEGVALMHG